MALRLYFDSALNNVVESEEFTTGEEDIVKEAIQSGNDIEDILSLYVASTDTNLTYENVSITQTESEIGDVNIQYRESGSTTWEDVLNLANGDYSTPLEIERKVSVSNVEEVINRTDIRHTIQFDKYSKG